MISWIKTIRRHIVLGRHAEMNGLAWFTKEGELRFVAPPEVWEERYEALERREREGWKLAEAYREALFHKRRADAMEDSIIRTMPNPFIAVEKK